MRKWIGDRDFYKMVMIVAIPIMVQNGITNFVSLLDNIMVGQVGTEQMSGVAIVNQLIFVFNLCIFGGLSGAGIFTAQFYGQGNQEGIRSTIRAKIWMAIVITILAELIFWNFGDRLISLYLHENNDPAGNAAALQHGMAYLRIMMIGLLPFMFVQVYSSTLRETGETILPMKGGILAVAVNMMLNYVLIFGKLGLPALGVRGAAIATVTSRFAECFFVLTWTHRHKEKNSYIEGLYRSMKVPAKLVGQIVKKGMPLLVNETLWSAGMAILLQCYSVRGLSVVAALNISNTIANVFNVAFLALGNAVAIIVGQLLGAGKMKEARETDTKLIAFSVAICFGLGVLLALTAPLFPRIYNTSDEVKALAVCFIWVAAFCMPQNAFMNTAYFTLRSGGKTVVTFFFDSVYMCCVNVPLAFVLSRYTGLHIVLVYFLCQMVDLVKCAIGFVLVKKGVWIQNIVVNE
ncbi:MAG: MATE family efflux transporter [bacterium]|nr:MATE family efflux transporter [bacterium]